MRENISQFFANLKEKFSRNPKTLSNSTNDKQAKNKTIVIAVIVVVLLVVVGGTVFYFTQDRASAPSTTSNLPKEVKEVMQKDEQVVNVLPESERLLKSTDKGYLEDPFEAPMVLVGVLQTKSGDNIATVRSGNVVYNVQKGDLIAGTWEVEEIYLDRIYISSADREIMLKMEN